MAYNYFPTGYQPAQYYPQVQQPPQQNSGIIWVQGEAGAKSYLVAPNTTVQLWDSEAQTIYLKSADTSGMPSIKTLDYTVRERVNADLRHENASRVEFITREEFEALKAEIQSLKATSQREVSRNDEHNTDVSADKK